MFRWGEHIRYRNWFTTTNVGLKLEFCCDMLKMTLAARTREAVTLEGREPAQSTTSADFEVQLNNSDPHLLDGLISVY